VDWRVLGRQLLGLAGWLAGQGCGEGGETTSLTFGSSRTTRHGAFLLGAVGWERGVGLTA